MVFLILQCLTSSYGSNLATSQSISLCFLFDFNVRCVTLQKFLEGVSCFPVVRTTDHFRLNCFIPVCATRRFLQELNLYHEFETDCPPPGLW